MKHIKMKAKITNFDENGKPIREFITWREGIIKKIFAASCIDFPVNGRVVIEIVPENEKFELDNTR